MISHYLTRPIRPLAQVLAARTHFATAGGTALPAGRPVVLPEFPCATRSDPTQRQADVGSDNHER